MTSISLMAPVDPIPVPKIVIGSVTPVSDPDVQTAAPSATVVEDVVAPFAPRPKLFEILITPSETVVVPVYVFAPESHSVPTPVLVRFAEEPVIMPS